MRSLDEIAAEIRDHHGSGCGCEPCETCTQLVPGRGRPDAAIVVAGEAPGAKEDAEKLAAALRAPAATRARRAR